MYACNVSVRCFLTMNCRLCGSKNIRKHLFRDNTDYFICDACGLLSMDHEKLPSNDELLQRYQKHENNANDQGYKKFLMELASPCFELMDNKSECLDYGCGPNKVMEIIFKEKGYRMESYDPFFYPDLPLKKYDFVTCNEVAEHFYSPFEEFVKIRDLIKDGGYLGLGTYLWDESTDLRSWHYLTDMTHVSIYSRRTIERLAGLLGLEVAESDGRRITILRKPGQARP
jgi:hypothetical protein